MHLDEDVFNASEDTSPKWMGGSRVDVLAGARVHLPPTFPTRPQADAAAVQA